MGLSESIALGDRQQLIVVYGPTGSGKTSLSIQIAHQIGQAEIVSVDSRQIYRGMDIGTGKITAVEMEDIPHHMLDIIDPDQEYSVYEFREQSEQILSDIWSRGHTPILCGGTGLYLDSLIFDRSYAGVRPDESRRQELEELARQYGKRYLWEMLHQKSPAEAARIHPEHIHGVIRSLELIEQGVEKGSIRDESRLRYPTHWATPYYESENLSKKIPQERKSLYDRIDRRVEMMVEQGLVEEVGSLLNRYGRTAPGLQTIGYREIVEYLYSETSLVEAVARIQQGNRNYAKRQICWNQKYQKYLTSAR